jgi:hypothetical protein
MSSLLREQRNEADLGESPFIMAVTWLKGLNPVVGLMVFIYRRIRNVTVQQGLLKYLPLFLILCYS